MTALNAPRWDGEPGFYEVWYLTLTDRGSGVGAWIRYTLHAPADGSLASASLWFLVMDPAGAPLARKLTLPDVELSASPFRVRIDGAELDDGGMRGAFEDVAWDLRWTGPGGGYRHVTRGIERSRVPQTVLVLPHADLGVTGTLTWGERTLTLDGARGGQAHLWGTRHAERWVWLHANDLEDEAGTPAPGAFLDAVSVVTARGGRELGPSTVGVARLGGRDLPSTAPHRALLNESRFTLTGWEFGLRAPGGRRIRGQADAPREHLAGVTYADPDGRKAYCYNTEIASLRLQLHDRSGLALALRAPGRAHMEYGQREPVPDVPLLLG